MVEFALALPILLTLLYGLLETGRLLFIYASTVTAARQAVRYGSATGDSPNGFPYYNDCGGIETAARQVGFINTFESVAISYDGGLNSVNGNPLPMTPAKTCGDANIPDNGDRIIVTVSAQWQPIVPIVPLEPFTITSQSERTILASISISVTAVPQGWQGSGNGILTFSISGFSPSSYSTIEPITYTYTLSNTGSGNLSAPFTVNDNIAATNCPSPPATLAPGASITCTGIYQVTQADLDAGSVTNTASASANGSPSNSDTETVYAIQSPALALSKSASPASASVAGTNVTYTYTLTNTGNVSLTSPYNVADNKIASVNCSGAASPLAPGASTACTASYSITNADITNGSVVNQAVASAAFNSTPVTSNSTNATVITASLSLMISPSPVTATLPNQIITYTYSISNNSGSAVNSLNLTASKGTVTCPGTTVPAGGSINCSGSYTVTQADLNTGGAIVNSATASGNNGAAVSSNTATASVVISQMPAITATITGSPAQPVPPATTISAGTVITYTYTLTNTGNVTLSSPFSVTDNKSAITCSNQTSINPGATKTCAGTYTVTAADVSAGSIVNTGTASAAFGAQTVTSSPASFTVITYSGARFSLALSANPATITQSGTSIAFTYTITNTGGKPLTSPYSITSSLASIGTFTCAGTSPLAPGASTSCTNNYTSSNTVTNTITAASAMDGATSVPSSNLPTITVPSNICSTGTLTLSAPNYSGNTVTWTISNNIGSLLNITSISVSWNTAGNRYLSAVELPTGTNIWSGSDKDGSFITPPGSWTIPTGNTTLTMLFTKTGITVTDMNLTFDEAGCGPLNNP